MKLYFDSKQFEKEMRNVIEYSVGFLDGVQEGKTKFFSNLARGTIDQLKQFIDSIARIDSEILHHVYEWGMTGSPSARLFDIDYTVTNMGLSLNSTFRQSISVKNGSTVPFYDKARIMEFGIPVTITPKRVLVFEDNGETIFTKKPVVITDPGGEATTGSFSRVLDMFINQYFSQSFLNASGIMDKIQDLSIYKKSLATGAKLGKGYGKKIGYSWIARAGVVD
jgi:hypothetical protein